MSKTNMFRTLKIFRFAAIIAISCLASCKQATDTGATKSEAVAMVKKAVKFIRQQGTEKAYKEFNTKGGQFTDRDLYIVVYGMNGVVLAHGANNKMINKNLIELTDIDGKSFVKERIELAQRNDSFWHEYKFINPENKKIEPKAMYCERLTETIVCGGVYLQTVH